MVSWQVKMDRQHVSAAAAAAVAAGAALFFFVSQQRANVTYRSPATGNTPHKEVKELPSGNGEGKGRARRSRFRKTESGATVVCAPNDKE